MKSSNSGTAVLAPKKPNPVAGFFKSIGGYITGFFKDIASGDIFVKLSLLVMGMGYFGRKQYIKGIIYTLFQAGVICFGIFFSAPYLAKFSTLGTEKYAAVFNPDTLKNEINDYDHSFKILLYSLVSFVVFAFAFVMYIHNIRKVRALEEQAKAGKHINSFAEDINEFRNKKFHTTLLFLPCLGVVVFTVVPLLVMILVAFTNYDQQHLPPAELFSWVGFANFQALFTNSVTVSFGYAFGKVLSWTLIWAFTATATTYIGGILLTLLINNKFTRVKRLWRSLFIVSIAVPQFVTLLVVRNFFANTGIVNTICANIGLTDFLTKIGLVSSSLGYIPFLTHPGWAKVMIILINIWIGVPYLMLIATGVLLNIPAELYESAKIDGASPFKAFIHITMPYMLFVTAPFLVTQVIQNINNFNVIYLLTQDVYRTTDQALANANAKEIDLLVTWLFRLTQEYYNYKMASVIGIMVFIVSAVLTLFAFNVVLRQNKEDKFQL